MKKVIGMITLLWIVFAFVSCSNVSTDTTTLAEDTGINKENTGAISCWIEYIFYSIEDMHTYITTGSTDLEDYNHAPDMPLEDIHDAAKVRALGYLPLSKIMDVEGEMFDSHWVTFQIIDFSSVIYRYYFDDICVEITNTIETENQTALSVYSQLRNQSATDAVLYSPDIKIQDGVVVRRHNETDVIYRYKDGVKASVGFIFGDYYVTLIQRKITNDSKCPDADARMEAYQAFLSDSKMEPFVPFFSDDEQIFNAQVDRIISAANDHVTE